MARCVECGKFINPDFGCVSCDPSGEDYALRNAHRPVFYDDPPRRSNAVFIAIIGGVVTICVAVVISWLF